MDTNQLRQLFLQYFRQLDHAVVPSAPLVPPGDDPTLLFTNAGMVPFKQVFMGAEARPYSCATSVQCCLRAGGKHNDLENVGYTRRHHTFFEMLGNFSFGDYFKQEAIQYAWNFITQVLHLPPERLWVTVYKDDLESENIWLKEMKIDPQRFSRCGEKDNFWSMGEVGPCGPCTEIFYDHGPLLPGGPPGSEDEAGDRYVEVWNLVFMQYQRNWQGELLPLPKPCVDTGMGLERIAAVMQGVHDDYEIDIFQYLLKSLCQLVGKHEFHLPSMRVIVDHIRAAAFLIAEGVIPSNEGRGYVLRRIIRRAIRHGHQLGRKTPFFYQLTPALTAIMGKAYPALIRAQSFIERTIEQEELQFEQTVEKGLKLFEQSLGGLQNTEIPGELVFQLYDTYGFPVDLTADIAKERGYSIDQLGFEAAMERQREKSQQASPFKMKSDTPLRVAGKTEFIGYEKFSGQANIIELFHNDQSLEFLEAGEQGAVILDRTPFYAESGGQVGDSGYLYFPDGRFRVKSTQKQGSVFLHFGELLEGSLHVQDSVFAQVDPSRQDIMLNHSATHLLHAALRQVLGEHVVQKGSLVEAERLRFDFVHAQPLTAEEIGAVEQMINQQIRENTPATVRVCSLEEAKSTGATALFGEKYGNEVRVVSMGDFSTEVCGGTHVQRTGDIGLFKITLETACAAGVRRIEAITGHAALLWVERNQQQLEEAEDLLKINRGELIPKISQLLSKQKEMEKERAQLQNKLAWLYTQQLAHQAVQMQDLKVVAAELPAVDDSILRNSLDVLKQQLGSCAIVLATVQQNKVRLVAGISKDCLKYFNAPELLNQVAQQVNGRGGGAT